MFSSYAYWMPVKINCCMVFPTRYVWRTLLHRYLVPNVDEEYARKWANSYYMLLVAVAIVVIRCSYRHQVQVSPSWDHDINMTRQIREPCIVFTLFHTTYSASKHAVSVRGDPTLVLTIRRSKTAVSPLELHSNGPNLNFSLWDMIITKEPS